MENFSIERDGAKLQKKTDGRKTETFVLDLPEMVNVKVGRSGIICGLTVKTKETNSGIVINIEAKTKNSGKFKGNGRLSDLLDEGGITHKDMEKGLEIILQNTFKGTFSSIEEFLAAVSSRVKSITGEKD
jgi:hypothetical protein